MEQHQINALLRQADQCRRAHNWQAAIDLLKRVLSDDPDHAQAHASLGLALLGSRRLHAAIVEVELALLAEPDSAFCHYATACVRRAQRKLDEAYQHCLVALQDDTSDVDTRVLAAAIKQLQNDRAAARALLLEALAIDGDNVAALTGLADVDLRDGNLTEAARRIDAALTASPSDFDAHVVAGYIALARNQVDDAEQHARFVLREDAANRDALGLWTSVKARRNIALGLWWRLNAFTGLRSERGQIGILLGSFVVVRLIILILGATGHEDAEALVGKIWLAFCAYTWFAPAIWRWMLDRELKTVALRDDY